MMKSLHGLSFHPDVAIFDEASQSSEPDLIALMKSCEYL